MRGWFSLFGNDRGTEDYSSGIFIATAEPSIANAILRDLPERFPKVKFTCLAPRSYAEAVPFQGERQWFEETKTTPLRSLIKLRKRRFDICVAILAGSPAFRKWKIAAFCLDVRRIIVFDEASGCSAVDRMHLWNLFRHMLKRRRWPSSELLFFPFGFSYLLVRTAWMIGAPRLRRNRDNTNRAGVP
jgi:hypothetical protein